MRRAASCCQPLQLSSVPRGARIVRSIAVSFFLILLNGGLFSPFIILQDLCGGGVWGGRVPTADGYPVPPQISLLFRLWKRRKKENLGGTADGYPGPPSHPKDAD